MVRRRVSVPRFRTTKKRTTRKRAGGKDGGQTARLIRATGVGVVAAQGAKHFKSKDEQQSLSREWHVDEEEEEEVTTGDDGVQYWDGNLILLLIVAFVMLIKYFFTQWGWPPS